MEIESISHGDGGENAVPALTNEDFIGDLRSCQDQLVGVPPDASLKQLRHPIVHLAEAARRTGVLPERMIAELKFILFRLPHFARRRAVERGEMMHQLTTIAINAYYARADD